MVRTFGTIGNLPCVLQAVSHAVNCGKMISLRYKLLVQHSALTPALMLLQYPKKGLLAKLCVGSLAEFLLALNKVAVFLGRSPQYLKQAIFQTEEDCIL